MTNYRLKYTTPEALPNDASEGLRAAWWRERIMGMSRRELADAIGVKSVITITKHETEGPTTQYRLACSALSYELEKWDWSKTGWCRSFEV